MKYEYPIFYNPGIMRGIFSTSGSELLTASVKRDADFKRILRSLNYVTGELILILKVVSQKLLMEFRGLLGSDKD